MLYVIMLQGLANNFHYLLASANLTKYVICEFFLSAYINIIKEICQNRKAPVQLIVVSIAHGIM